MPERTTSVRERRPRLPSRARRSSAIASDRASDPVVQRPARRVRTNTTTARTLTRACDHQKPTHASTRRVENSKFAHPTRNRRSDDPTIRRVPHARSRSRESQFARAYTHEHTHTRSIPPHARARTINARVRASRFDARARPMIDTQHHPSRGAWVAPRCAAPIVRSSATSTSTWRIHNVTDRYRTIGRSDDRTFGVSWVRTFGMSWVRTFGVCARPPPPAARRRRADDDDGRRRRETTTGDGRRRETT